MKDLETYPTVGLQKHSNKERPEWGREKIIKNIVGESQDKKRKQMMEALRSFPWGDKYELKAQYKRCREAIRDRCK